MLACHHVVRYFTWLGHIMRVQIVMFWAERITYICLDRGAAPLHLGIVWAYTMHACFWKKNKYHACIRFWFYLGNQNSCELRDKETVVLEAHLTICNCSFPGYRKRQAAPILSSSPDHAYSNLLQELDNSKPFERGRFVWWVPMPWLNLLRKLIYST